MVVFLNTCFTLVYMTYTGELPKDTLVTTGNTLLRLHAQRGAEDIYDRFLRTERIGTLATLATRICTQLGYPGLPAATLSGDDVLYLVKNHFLNDTSSPDKLHPTDAGLVAANMIQVDALETPHGSTTDVWLDEPFVDRRILAQLCKRRRFNSPPEYYHHGRALD